MADILMPKATAVWLIDNTTLTFKQVADFCGLHTLEVKGIADGDVAENMRGVDPISGGELTREAPPCLRTLPRPSGASTCPAAVSLSLDGSRAATARRGRSPSR